MKKFLFLVIGLFLLSGCTVRTYQLTRDRVDQNLSEGNRGYIMGRSKVEEKDRKPTRTTRVIEIELSSPIKFDNKAQKTPMAPAAPVTKIEEKEEVLYGNRGYITASDTIEIDETPANFKEYKVQKNDTLQKISQKFYGTTKKWKKIFEANKDTLKSPDRLYPGKTIRIPQDGTLTVKETLRETEVNLK